jgi:hypothetical protein
MLIRSSFIRQEVHFCFEIDAEEIVQVMQAFQRLAELP